MDQAPIVVPRGFKRFWATIIGTGMGVGFCLLDDGNGSARSGSDDKVKRKGIGRVWQGIEGVSRMMGMVWRV